MPTSNDTQGVPGQTVNYFCPFVKGAKISFLLEPMSANLPTLAKDEKGLHAAACEFSKLFEYRVQYLCTHSPDVLLNTAPINGSQLKHHRH